MPELCPISLYGRGAFFRPEFPFAITRVVNDAVTFNPSRRFRREFWKIALITAGEGDFIINDRHFPFTRNTLILVHPDAVTTYDIKGKAIRLYNIVFDRSFLLPELLNGEDPLDLWRIFSRHCHADCASPFFLLRSSRRIDQAVRAMYEEFTGNALNRETLLRTSLHWLLLMMLRQSVQKSRRHPRWIAEHVKALLNRDCAGEFRLDAMAEKLELTPEQLCRLYKKEFGTTIGAELRRIRIARAQELLLHTPLPAGRIGAMCGFPVPAYFYRVFAAACGLPPGAWRQRHAPRSDRREPVC